MLFDRVSLSVHNGHTESPHCHQQQRRYCHRHSDHCFHLVQSSFAVLRPFISRPLVGWTGPSPACAGEPAGHRPFVDQPPIYPCVRGTAVVIILVAVQMGLSPHTRGNPWPFDNASCYLIRQGDNGDLLAAIYQIRPSPSTVSLDLRVPTLGWRLPQPATPGKYQDSYHPIPREPPTYAMASPHRRLSQPQPASNARHQAR